jgi:hypothetical protein
MFKLPLDVLKRRYIVTNPNDIIPIDLLNPHPSYGKYDEIVWAFEYVLDEFKCKVKKIPFVMDYQPPVYTK